MEIGEREQECIKWIPKNTNVAKRQPLGFPYSIARERIAIENLLKKERKIQALKKVDLIKFFEERKIESKAEQILERGGGGDEVDDDNDDDNDGGVKKQNMESGAPEATKKRNKMRKKERKKERLITIFI